MAPSRTIKINDKLKLDIFEKSVKLNSCPTCLFLRTKIDELPKDVLDVLVDMIKSSYSQGRYDQRQEMRGKYEEFLRSFQEMGVVYD